jgi:hypothetical protein
MITNCLDTKNNTWDDGYQTTPSSDANLSSADTLSAENQSITVSNFTSAQNCHRVKDPSFSNAGGDGWNNVTPWIDPSGGYGSGNEKQDNPGIR